MRKLGQELGVEAMSLYNHVANKDEVLDGIVEAVVREVDLPSDETDWKAALRQHAISAHEALMRHSWAASLWWRRAEGPDRMRGAEFMLRTLREAGFSEDLTYHGYHVLVGHILGFTLQAQSFPIETKEELAEMAAKFLEDFPVERVSVPRRAHPSARRSGRQRRGRVRVRARSDPRRPRANAGSRLSACLRPRERLISRAGVEEGSVHRGSRGACADARAHRPGGSAGRQSQAPRSSASSSTACTPASSARCWWPRATTSARRTGPITSSSTGPPSRRVGSCSAASASKSMPLPRSAASQFPTTSRRGSRTTTTTRR